MAFTLLRHQRQSEYLSLHQLRQTKEPSISDLYPQAKNSHHRSLETVFGREKQQILKKKDFSYFEEQESDNAFKVHEFEPIEKETQSQENRRKPKQISRQSHKKINKEKKDAYKNFLPVIKRALIATLQREAKNKLESIQTFKSKQSQSGTNMNEIRAILSNKQIRSSLRKLFLNKKLARQIQLCRLQGKNRILFIERISSIRRGFLMGRLNHL